MNKIPYPSTHEEAEALKKSYARRKPIDRMHQAYGTHVPDHCGDCKHFLVDQWHSRKYLKCTLYKVTNGPATDWRKFYDACGKFERREDL
jgi:hypothetical protein